LDGHAFDSADHLLVVTNVGAQSHGDAAAMFDFEMGQVQLSFRSSQQSDAGSSLGKAQREPLPDASAGAGDEYAFVF
jgi:sorbitol-specific phosphotransferase system component IIA